MGAQKSRGKHPRLRGGGGEEEETDRHKGNKGTEIVWKIKKQKPLRQLGGHIVGPSSETYPKLDYVSEILGPQASTPRGVLMSLVGARDSSVRVTIP